MTSVTPTAEGWAVNSSEDIFCCCWDQSTMKTWFSSVAGRNCVLSWVGIPTVPNAGFIEMIEEAVLCNVNGSLYPLRENIEC
ncbi:hypothetical protein NQZ68_004913 [Dissostichus eleginoides]|nr:hypothetical protein NQZ68_004913 [Dissostichus eleginoides]